MLPLASARMVLSLLPLASARMIISDLTDVIGVGCRCFRLPLLACSSPISLMSLKLMVIAFACFCSHDPLLSHSCDWSWLLLLSLASACMVLSYLTHVIGADGHCFRLLLLAWSSAISLTMELMAIASARMTLSYVTHVM